MGGGVTKMGHTFLRLNATTSGERHRMIELAKDAIAASGGWILDFTMFSNVSICFNFELPFNAVARLRDALAAIELRLSEASTQAFEEFAGKTEQGTPPAELKASLQITFIHREPDLRIPVPMIPG